MRKVEVDTRGKNSSNIFPRQRFDISYDYPCIHEPAEYIAPDETKCTFSPQRPHKRSIAQ